MNTTNKCQGLNNFKSENSPLTPVNTTEVNSLLLNKHDFLDKNNNNISNSNQTQPTSSTKKPLIKSLSLTTSSLLNRNNLRLSLKKQETQNKLINIKEAPSNMNNSNSQNSNLTNLQNNNNNNYQNHIEVSVIDTSLPVINENTASFTNKNAQNKSFSKNSTSSTNLKKVNALNATTPATPASTANTNIKSSTGGLLSPSITPQHHHHLHYHGGEGGGGRGRRESFLYRADVNDGDNSFTPKMPGLRSGSIISGEQ
jgi:hypothetical protein